MGTNGPVLQAVLTDAEGKPLTDAANQPLGPGMETRTVTRDGTCIAVSVAAAPWIPLEEIRVFVNGTRMKTAADDISKLSSIVNRDQLGSVPCDGAAAIVQAGGSRPRRAGNRATSGWSSKWAWCRTPPPTCDDDGLPDLPELARPLDTSDPRFHYNAIVPGGLPVAFTNPFLLDLDGDGVWTPPGL